MITLPRLRCCPSFPRAHVRATTMPVHAPCPARGGRRLKPLEPPTCASCTITAASKSPRRASASFTSATARTTKVCDSLGAAVTWTTPALASSHVMRAASRCRAAPMRTLPAGSPQGTAGVGRPAPVPAVIDGSPMATAGGTTPAGPTPPDAAAEAPVAAQADAAVAVDGDEESAPAPLRASPSPGT